MIFHRFLYVYQRVSQFGLNKIRSKDELLNTDVMSLKNLGSVSNQRGIQLGVTDLAKHFSKTIN